MATGFKFVINFLSLIGTFDGSAALVNEIPFLRAPNGFRKQAKIVFTVGVVGATVFGSGAATRFGTSPLLAVLRLIKSVGFHRAPFGADRNTCWRDLNIAICS